MPDTDQTPPAGDEESAAHRLFGIFVKEVSLVDRAANKRRFLVTKRDTTMPKPAAPKAPKVTVAKNAGAVAKGPEQGGAETAADAAGAAPGGGADGAGAPTQGGTGAPADGALPSMQPQVKDQILAAIEGLAMKLLDIADAVKGAEADEKATGPAVPPAVMGDLKEVAQAMAGMVAQYGGEGAGDGAATTAAAAAAAPPTQTKDLEGTSENGGVQAQGTQKGTVAKAGRKMAKERLARLSQVLSALSGIYRELNSEKAMKAALAKRAGPKAGDVIEISKADLDAIFATADAINAEAKGLETRAAALTRENAELRKSVGAPNALPGELSTARPSAPSAGVHWPMDLNAPKKQTPNFGSAARRQ